MICPFCSLLCDADDLNEVCCGRRDSSLVEVGKIIRVWHGSPNRDPDFTLLSKPESQLGEPSYTNAICDAVNLLRSATRVLVTGRIASVQTARAAVTFAAKYNATIDCADSGHAFKNILAIQRSGLNSVSLAEARDLSDLFIVIGDDQLLARTPRMPTALANAKGDKRTVLLLGDFNESSMSIWRDSGFDVWFVPCDVNSIPKALAQWSKWSDSHFDTWPAVVPLFERLAHAKYTTVIWSAENLRFENADLWIERLLQWIATRNQVSRCAALLWSMQDGTFQQVCTWLTGFPGRIAFRNGTPEYDPFRFAYMEWIAKSPANETVKSLLVVIDETLSATPFLDFRDLQTDMEILEVTVNSKTFPTAIAGVEFAADMFRADYTLLARVEPSIEPRPFAKSAADWLEAMSKW